MIYTVLMLGYFLSVGLLNSKDNLRRAVQALCVSLLLVGLYGLYQNFTGNISTEWIDTEMFDNIGGRVVSTFENPNMLGEYLILLLPILAAFAICERPLTSKSSTMVAFAVGAACLIYTWARGAWLGFFACGGRFPAHVEQEVHGAACDRRMCAAVFDSVFAGKYFDAFFQYRRFDGHFYQLSRVYLAGQYEFSRRLRMDWHRCR